MPYSDGLSDDQMKSFKSRRDRGKKWLRKAEEAFKKQTNWLAYWQRLAEVLHPSRADFTGKWADATERYDNLYSVEAAIQRRDLADSLGATMRTDDADWMNIVARPDDVMDDHEALLWLQMATKRQKNVIYANGANFNRCMKESDNDYVTFGTSVISHTYNRLGNGLLFRCHHLRDCAWMENSEGVVDQVYRKIKEPLYKHAQMFGYANLPKKWREAIDAGNEFDDREVINCVAPIEMYETDKLQAVPQDTRFISLYLATDQKDEDCILAENVFKSFPYRVRRWETVSGEMAGRSPVAELALPDARELNAVESALGRGVEWKIDPPRVAQHDAIIGDIRIEAGGITYLDDDYDARTGDPLKALEVGEPGYAMDLINKKRETLSRCFHANLFSLPSKTMSATEARMRQESLRREAAPIFHPYEEDLGFIMESVFVRSLDKGLFGQLDLETGSPIGLPEALSNADIDFEFVTPLTDADNAITVAQYDDMQAASMRAAQSGDEAQMAAYRQVDWDKATRDRINASAPTKWLKSPEQIEHEREQAAEQAQEQQEMQELMAAGELATRVHPKTMERLDKAIEEEG